MELTSPAGYTDAALQDGNWGEHWSQEFEVNDGHLTFSYTGKDVFGNIISLPILDSLLKVEHSWVWVAGTSYFIDHFGEKFVPRVRHEQTAMPTAVNGYIGYDHTVHGLMDEDYDETFMTEGTNRFELGVELGLGFEYKSFQLTLSYQ